MLIPALSTKRLMARDSCGSATHMFMSAPDESRAIAACDCPSQMRVPAVPKSTPPIRMVALPVIDVGQVQDVPTQSVDGNT